VREGEWAVIEVSDDGPGLSPEDAGRVFDPFYRADPSRERLPAGEGDAQSTGLGLAIVAAIAEAHGGGAGVQSEPGHGARFTVRVPIGTGGEAGSLQAPGLE
jgi:two-component system OmpR family sensor kinase